MWTSSRSRSLMIEGDKLGSSSSSSSSNNNNSEISNSDLSGSDMSGSESSSREITSSESSSRSSENRRRSERSSSCSPGLSSRDSFAESDAKLRSVVEDARSRWLLKEEVAWVLLQSPEAIQGLLPLYLHTLMQPKSGTLIMYNKRQTKKYKKDGWNWLKKKGSTTSVREDYIQQQYEGVIILCTYVHSAEVPTFHRRSYRLDQSDMVLVHYFDESNKLSMTQCKRRADNLDKKSESMAEPDSNPLEMNLELYPLRFNMLEKYTASHNPKTTQKDDTTDTASLEDTLFLLDYNPHDTINQFLNDSMDLSLDIHEDLGNTSTQEYSALMKKPNIFEENTTSLEQERYPTSFLSSPKSPYVDRILTAIADFSPNWDFVGGGTKVLICLTSSLPQVMDPGSLVVCFGLKDASAEILTDTVLRCVAPTCDAGVVDLCIYEKYPERKQLSDVRQFEFRSTLARQALAQGLEFDEPSPPRRIDKIRKREYPPLSTGGRFKSTFPRNGLSSCSSRKKIESEQEAHAHDREFKIRVVERLSEFHKAILTSPKVDAKGSHGMEDEEAALELSKNVLPTQQLIQSKALVADELDDYVISNLDDTRLQTISEELIQWVVQQLVEIAETSHDLKEELNALDDAGLSLLHYICFYNYEQLVPFLLSHGAQVNQLSQQGQTALHLAASSGYWGIVKILLENHADPTICDLEGLTAAERADNNDHFAVADYLRWVSGEDASPPRNRRHSIKSMVGQDLLKGEASLESLYEEEKFDSGSQQHKKQLLLGAFSSMSLHDKCALSLSMTRDMVDHVGLDPLHHAGDQTSDLFSEAGSDLRDQEVTNVITENDVDASKLKAAMKLMGPDELASLEEETKKIQHNVRNWLLRRSCKNMRDTTRRLQRATEATQGVDGKDDMARAAVTVQAATRTMLARRNFLQTRNVTIKVQAATRGALCRKNFARMKKHALAALVIQRNVLAWRQSHGATKYKDSEETSTFSNETIDQPVYHVQTFSPSSSTMTKQTFYTSTS